VKRRLTIEYPSQHLINFANARLGRLPLKLDRKGEAREVLCELAEETKDSNRLSTSTRQAAWSN